jgi:hypothetical protein
MPVMVLYPIFTIVLSIILIMWFMASSAAIKSMGGEETVDASTANVTSYTKFTEGQYTTYVLFFNLFGFLWCINFVQGIGMMTIAGAIGQWYFTRPPADGSEKDLPNSAVFASFRRVFAFHLGSIALGSFIVAIIQTARAILEYVDRQTKQAQEGSCIAKYGVKVLKCCLWCFEKCMKYLSYNAYVLVATRGKEFIPAACRAFGLILDNIVTIGILNVVSALMLTLGKIFIMMSCTFAGYQWLNNAPEFQASTTTSEGGENELTNKFVPLAMLALSAYTMARCFLGVYGMAIDTIMLCFCEDLDEYGHDKEELYYMGPDLRHAMGYKGDPTREGADLLSGPSKDAEATEGTEKESEMVEVTGTDE